MAGMSEGGEGGRWFPSLDEIEIDKRCAGTVNEKKWWQEKLAMDSLCHCVRLSLQRIDITCFHYDEEPNMWMHKLMQTKQRKRKFTITQVLSWWIHICMCEFWDVCFSVIYTI